MLWSDIELVYEGKDFFFNIRSTDDDDAVV